MPTHKRTSVQVYKHTIVIVFVILTLLGPAMPTHGGGTAPVFLPIVVMDPTHGAHWGSCTRVVDGDTIVVILDDCAVIPSFRVRLLGIDTPERGACYFGEASERTRELVDGQRVALQRGPGVDADGWGRLLRHVYTERGQWVNGALVAEGYARTYMLDARDPRTPALVALEAQARAGMVGGWAACDWQ